MTSYDVTINLVAAFHEKKSGKRSFRHRSSIGCHIADRHHLIDPSDSVMIQKELEKLLSLNTKNQTLMEQSLIFMEKLEGYKICRFPII